MNPTAHGCNLDHVANDEDDNTKRQAFPASKPVGGAMAMLAVILPPTFSPLSARWLQYVLSSAKGSNETPDAHEGDKQGLDDWSPSLRAIRLSLCESVDEVFEEEHAGDLPSIVAEEKAANGRGDGEHDGLDTTVGAIDAD